MGVASQRWSGGRRPAVIILAVAAALTAPLLIFGIPITESGRYNYLWTLQFAEGYAAGDFYPRWFPASFEGLGSPTFYFYPPLSFWISGALRFAGASVDDAVALTGFAFLAASGFSMYAWLRFRGSPALLGACLYMAAPYHLFDLYRRGALAEFAAFVWLPLIALGLQALPRRWAVPLLAVSTAGLLLTHLPTAVLAAAFLILPLALQALRENLSVFLPGLTAGVIGVALATFYLLPAATLQQHISEPLLWLPQYQPQDQLLWSIHPNARFLPIMAIVLAACAFARISFWTAIAAVAAAAVVGLIPFLWDIPLFAKVQFPWRLLAIVEFAAITAMIGAPTRRLVPAATVTLVFTVAVAMLTYPFYKNPSAEGPARAGRTDAPEYLPRGVEVPDVNDVELLVPRWRVLPRGSVVDVKTPGPVTIGRSAFPIWQVTRDGRHIPSTGPFMTFDAVPGRYRVQRVVIWQEWVGAAVSISALVGLLLLYRRPSPIAAAGAHRTA